MDDVRGKDLFCEAIALLKEIAESRGQFYSEEEYADYFNRVEDVIKGTEEMESKKKEIKWQIISN